MSGKNIDLNSGYGQTTAANIAHQEGYQQLIVSLTSYPARIHSVALSIETIYQQTKLPDKIILWLVKADFPRRQKDLPEELLKLESENGLCICWCDEDLKPHNKYFWAFKEYPDALVVTIDDDVLYHRKLIENLYHSYVLHPHAVSAARICFVPVSKAGEIPPYELWPTEVDAYVGIPSMQLCATGVGGVLYPTKLFTGVSALFDADTIKRTCLYEDDLWLKAVELIAEIPVVVAEEFKGIYSTPDSQEVGLKNSNIGKGGSQRQLLQIQNEIDCRYGKNTFMRKLMNTPVGENLVGVDKLAKLVTYYNLKGKKQVNRIKKQYERYSTLCVYVRNKGNNDCSVMECNVIPSPLYVGKPPWLTNGFAIRSTSQITTVDLQCQGDGVLEIGLYGREVRNDEGNRYPVWIDCNYLRVNGQTIFKETKSVCYDKRYVYKRKVADGEVVQIYIEWSECQSSAVLGEYLQLQEELKRTKTEKDKLIQTQAKTEKLLEKEKLKSAKTDRELKRLKNGRALKIGNAILYFPRKIQCLLKEQGLRK